MYPREEDAACVGTINEKKKKKNIDTEHIHESKTCNTRFTLNANYKKKDNSPS